LVGRDGAELGVDKPALKDCGAFLSARRRSVTIEQRGHVDLEPGTRTQRAKRATCGLLPGISVMTITVGPVPAGYAFFATPSNIVCLKAKSSSGSSSGMPRTGTAPVLSGPAIGRE
jgi:hypothetical protein